MKALGKTLLLIIATLMVVDPVIACCLPAYANADHSVSIESNETNELPCHTAIKPVNPGQSDPTSGLSEQACCDGCVSAMMASESIDAAFCVSTFDEDIELAGTVDTSAKANVIIAISYVDLALEPWFRPPGSLVSLKQKLLI